MRSRVFVAFGVLVALSTGSILWACKVPVFRYALERWPADNYRMVAVIERQSPDVDEALADLRALRSSNLNAEIDVIVLDTLSETALWQVEGFESTDQLPLLQVFYPEKEGQRKLCWSGALTKANVAVWESSALRTKIASKIQSGASAVWLFIDGDDAAENTALYNNLKRALAAASNEIEIPDGVIQRQDASRVLSENPTASLDDVLRSDIPLRIQFSICRLAKSNDSETAMRALVNSWAQDKTSPQSSGPVIVPVFGRGRMIDPMPIQMLSQETVQGVCRYLVGECSCSVKALSPGVDLLLNTDWKTSVGGDIVMVASEQGPPELVEIPSGVNADANAVVEPSEGSTEPPVARANDSTELVQAAGEQVGEETGAEETGAGETGAGETETGETETGETGARGWLNRILIAAIVLVVIGLMTGLARAIRR